ncbi:MAG: C40 family peptidase [Steroidobacteraceae bacterium]
MIRAALCLSLPMVLAACAGAPPRPYVPPNSAPEPNAAESRPSLPQAQDERAIMIRLATSMLGQPYRFGGAAPGGFDCSGLVVYAAGGAGIRMPRTAQEQLGVGRPVAREDLQAGDLIFMHLAHKELHVGIALDGGRFIHAPSTGGHVRIDSLAAPPYARGFIGARQIVTAP